MLKHTLLSGEGILILEPSDALEAADFEAVIHDIDPYLADHESLAGVMIFAKAFPGWLNLEAAISHLQLIENYHQKIKRLAIVSDNGLLTALPKFAAHLVHPDVKHFSESEYEDALSWLRSSHS
ncbi:SpoIIAA family protein [Rhodopirellula baltica]|uniref:STAS/SEC14 domain-containing protein n=1 Tax=Rhodopirellula baltica TaxID=265606 RepID=UPI0009DA6B5A|nr:STAS/SEC14 domain-containing protein [Rhodopirellula baltica]